jgi:D-alanyl-D-alanine carboxypeptidase/D-alanyl-D-alanine-endopeptidase (penicillin-binding protein 4)
LRQLSQFSRGQLDILGFEGTGPEDHTRHLRAMGLLFERAAPAPVAPKAPSTLEELRALLEAHVTQPRFHAAAWSVKVVSLDSGRTLYEHDADRLLSPASNSKLYTGALALTRLGGDYRIVTPLYASRAPDANGVVAGDVIVSGRGDPSWKSGAKREDFWKIFAPFGAALTQAGVRRITGDIVADATYFRGVPNGSGWTADDLNDYYGAEISAISLEDNYAELRMTPAVAAGAPGELAWVQPHTGLMLDNRLTTVAKGTPKRFEVLRLFGENVVHVFGEVPVGAAPFTEDVTVLRPASWFAAALKEALGRRGIEVSGQARSIRWPETPASTDGAVKLGEISSPPLRELVSAFMKPSQNLETDLIFAHVGETLRTAETPARRTSEQLGLQALRDFLRANGLPVDDVRFDEGSGLSRNNLTSANATTALLAFMAAQREANAFADALPIAGVDGTLRRRMKGTAAEGNVRAKTGTLRWANALSGYVTSAAGERLAFSVMVNRNVAAPGRNARDDLDTIAVMLAGFSGRSTDGAKPAGQ